MLLGYLDLLFSDPLAFLRVFPIVVTTIGVALLAAITVHEFSHALTSYVLGDTTAKRLGRLSLNPVRHMDPTGTALLFLVGFGWGKPVPVNAAMLRRGRRGMAAVAAAGPFSNVATAFLLSVPIKAGLLAWPIPFLIDPAAPLSGGAVGLLSHILGLSIFFNLILAVFNLLPFYPLDGSNVALGLLPRELARRFARLERYGPVLLVSVIMLDIVARVGVLRAVIGPVVNYLGRVAVGVEFF